MRFDDHEARSEFESTFGHPIEELSAGQLWWFVKFAKHARLRCRSNAAFNNWATRVFPQARFDQVAKVARSGRAYMGLRITVAGETREDTADSDIL